MDFLVGGGEMGRRMRELDWSDTLAGAIESWPHSLKVAVSICLGSRHPMVVWWGRRAYAKFYNDAYISFLGQSKHPSSLGRAGRECWSDIWPVIGPMLESVYATGEATWSEDLLLTLDRHLPREGGYFTFSYSPIRDDEGAIGGIFCACNETTTRVLGERRLRTLRDLNRVEAVYGSTQALERIQSYRPDVVLLDIGMPGIDGYEVCRRMRVLHELGEVYLIAMTGYGQTDDRAHALAAGFDAHLIKPVDMAILRRELMNASSHEIPGTMAPGGQNTHAPLH